MTVEPRKLNPRNKKSNACAIRTGRGHNRCTYTAYARVAIARNRVPGSFAVVSPDALKQRKRGVPSVEAAQQKQTGAK